MRDRGRLTRRGQLAVLAPAALAVVGLPAAIRAQDPGFDPVARLVYAVEYARDPQISPNGEWIAYVHRFADRTEDRWHAEIVLTRSDGSDRETLTSGPDDLWPRFSPTGDRLAYVSHAGGFWEIRVLSLATRRRADLAAGSSPIGSMAWAPVGDRIAFLRHGSDPDTRVHLYVASVSSGRVRQLTSTGFPVAALPLDTRLAWTPDGAALLFSADPDPRDAPGEASAETPSGGESVPGIPTRIESDVLEIPSSGGAVRRLTSWAGPEDDPTASPDGRRFAFVSAGPAGAGRPGRALRVLERSGGALPRSLLERGGLDVRRPEWAPDGRHLFAIVENGGRARLAFIGLDGSDRTLADGLGGGPTATGGSASFSISADSVNPRFAATAVVDGSPGEILVGSRRRGDLPRRVTWINDDLDRGARIAFEQVTVAPDTPAWALSPADGGGADLPAILAIHGGCGSTYTAGFDLELAAFAAAGHVVLALDPEGSADVVLAAADTLAARPGPASRELALLERGGDGTLARDALGRSDAFRGAVVHRPPGCRADAPGPDEPTVTAPLLILDAPAHPFDEPPAALVARLRRTLDGLRAGNRD